jgi:hypothetical protein
MTSITQDAAKSLGDHQVASLTILGKMAEAEDTKGMVKLQADLMDKSNLISAIGKGLTTTQTKVLDPTRILQA